MNKVLIPIILAAGAATFVYLKMGRRIGYSNNSTVWKVTIVTFVISFLVFWTFLTYIL